MIATDDQKLTGKTTLTITVTQVDEDGEVSFSSIQPAIGVAITASISDPDGSVSGETWQWSRAQTAGRHLSCPSTAQRLTPTRRELP